MIRSSLIQRTMVIEGLVTPAIIHNGSYFFINLPVYQDGLVDCWEMVDLELFQKKLDAGWVVASIPDGESISVHGLGNWKISEGHWELDAKGLYQRVVSLLKELNPELRNLYNCHGQTSRKVGKVSVSIFGMPKKTPIRQEKPDSIFSKKILGEGLSIFVKREDAYYLADLRVFADQKVEIGRLSEPMLMTLEELARALKEGRLLTNPPIGAKVVIDQFGTFLIAQEHWSAQPNDMLLEAQDLIEKLNGRPDSIEKCRRLWRAYEQNPSNEARDALRFAYESIPEHNRMYVGDMDSKDGPVRAIIYGEELYDEEEE